MNCHIKVITDTNKSIAFNSTLCGLDDFGQLMYIAFNATSDEDVERTKKRAEMGKADDTTLCQRCCTAIFGQLQIGG